MPARRHVAAAWAFTLGVLLLLCAAALRYLHIPSRQPETPRMAASEGLEPLPAVERVVPAAAGGRVEAAYAQSYLAVQALIDRHGARKIPALLGALGRTGSMNDAFAATYPGDLPGFEQQLRRQLGG